MSRAGSWAAALAIALAVGVRDRAIPALYFTDLDTFPLILTGRARSLAELGQVLSRPLAQGRMANARFFRPLASLSFGLDERLFGLDPRGFHLVGILLHLGAALACFAFARALYRAIDEDGRGATLFACLAALLFAVHPIHLEVVPGIARRPDVLLGLFSLLALHGALAHLRGQARAPLIAALIAYVLAVVSKDPAIVVPALVAALGLVLTPGALRARLRASLRLTAPFVLVTLPLLAWRVYALGGLGGYDLVVNKGPMALTLEGLRTLLGVVVWPGAPERLEVLPVAGLVALLGVAIGLTVWGARARSPRPGNGLGIDLGIDPGIGFCLLALGGLFALNLVTRTEVVVRTLYLPSAFLAIALGRALALALRSDREGWGRRARLGLAAGLVLAVPYGSITTEALDRWRDDSRIRRTTLQGLEPGLRRLPVGTRVFLVNLPYKLAPVVEGRLARPLRVSAGLFGEPNLQAWAELVLPSRRLELVRLSYLLLPRSDQAIAARVSFDPSEAILSIRLGPTARVGYPWPQAYARKTAALYQVLEGKTVPGGWGGADRLRLRLTPAAFSALEIAFAVHLGDRVVVRGGERWTEASGLDPGGGMENRGAAASGSEAL